ncbi:hypothetical protein F4810DRAFT_469326 [Camillea tinctor]|nr:hypothetical protein F4810DRAFT_469326 [Camillea tinctor]
MTELGRAVQTALRSAVSASPLRTSTRRWQPCHNLVAASLTRNNSSWSSSSGAWSSSAWTGGSPRTTRIDQAEGYDIRKPLISAYDQMSNSESPDDYDALNNDTNFSAGIDIEINDIKNAPANNIQKEPAAPTGPSQRLVPRTGRTVYVRQNVDVARSFKLLAIQVAQNRLRQDFQNQRFHMRPGLKRKKLVSERHRRRFMKGFKGAVKRVQELTRQGW